jgi:hypothetical protein
MIICGIDPGVTGAFAFFDHGALSSVHDLPAFDGRIDGLALSVDLNTNVDAVYLENTHPMPRNGSIASYKLGLNTGIIIGVVQSLSIPLYRISVASWRNFNGLRSKDKSASRGLARELYPHMANELRLASHHNRAEAILIGRYGVYHQIQREKSDEAAEIEREATVSDLRRHRATHPSGAAS